MVYKVSVDDVDSKNQDYNAAPEGLVEITEDEFVKSDFFVYTPTKIEHRQVLTNNKFLELHMFYVDRASDKNGFAFSTDYWKGKIRYFRFGCKHEWREYTPTDKPQFKCYHYTKCTKCGAEWEYDSSG